MENIFWPMLVCMSIHVLPSFHSAPLQIHCCCVKWTLCPKMPGSSHDMQRLGNA